MAKKPDRWMRLSARIADAYPCNSANTDALIRDIVVILRREHAAMVRAVKRLRWCRPVSMYNHAYNRALDDVLEWLEVRKK